jgi:hypothetical protein
MRIRTTQQARTKARATIPRPHYLDLEMVLQIQ